ncbi:PAS domain S-box protein [Agromyces marinus]|nr:PAS domain S-box protein [Agromyces marinus]UIP59017.1 Adaptive-response sensory-kinase SasA [Agromyces marinus]
MSERGTILLVAESEGVLRELTGILEPERYTALTSPPLPDRVLGSLRVHPDLVVIDAGLRNGDAIALAAALHADVGTDDVPVAFVAPADDVGIRVRALAAGDDLMSTPFDPQDVLDRVERLVVVSRLRRALRESQAGFREAAASEREAVVTADERGVIRGWNDAATALLGHTEAQALGQPVGMLVPLRERHRFRASLDRVRVGDDRHIIGASIDLSVARRDGTEFLAGLSYATWVFGGRRYFTGIVRELEDRAVDADAFGSVPEASIDAIVSADRDGRIVAWNSAATRVLGYEEEEAVGRLLDLIVPPEFHDAHHAGMRRYAETGEAKVIGRTVELSARTKAGERIPIELSLSTWMIRGERFYTGIIRDIGERRAAEAAIRRSERDLRARSAELREKNAALEGTLDQLSRMQDQLILQEKMASLGRLSAGMAHELNNPASAAQRGSSQAQAAFAKLQVTQLELGRLGLYGSRLERLRELDALAAERADRPAEYGALERSDREAAVESWLDEHGVAEAGELAPSLVSLGIGIDDLERLEEVFPEEERRVIVVWLSQKYLVYSLLAEVAVGTTRMVELVKALKTYTYMDQAPVQDVDVRHGLDNTLVMLHNKLKRGVRVVKEYDADLPTIQAHASELNQVWTNLIDNAIDAMGGEGTLTVRARGEGDRIVVEVEDDGPGMSPEARSRVFDPFFTTKPLGEGTGLGLPISRNIIVKKHHGDLEVDSGPAFTRFTARLPVGVAPSDDGEED